MVLKASQQLYRDGKEKNLAAHFLLTGTTRLQSHHLNVKAV